MQINCIFLLKKSCFFFLFFFLFFFVSAVSFSSKAVVIQFPEEELAMEYVFPVFENPSAVLNRIVTLSNRLELRISGAFRTDEPLYTPYSLAGSLAFFWNESHGIGVSGLFFLPGFSDVGRALKQQGVIVESEGQDKGTVNFYYNALLAPHFVWAGFLNYQFSPLYGKISITKTVVLNVALYSFIGGGAVFLRRYQEVLNTKGSLMTQSVGALITVPGVHFGIGQRIYLNRYFAFDGGVDFLVYDGFNPVSAKLKREPNTRTGLNIDPKDLKRDVFVRFLVRMGLTILL